MGKRIRSVLLAAAVVATAPLAQPAGATLQPAHDCGFVSYRDPLVQSNAVFLAEWAYIAGVPGEHTDTAISCWLQDESAQVAASTTIECTEGSVGTGCATAQPTSFGLWSESMQWCTRAEWFDHPANAVQTYSHCDPVTF